jgi:hypothetical protein
VKSMVPGRPRSKTMNWVEYKHLRPSLNIGRLLKIGGSGVRGGAGERGQLLKSDSAEKPLGALFRGIKSPCPRRDRVIAGICVR